jgi:hypothetical protein
MTSSPLHPPAATESILVIGGCKSGKSRHALALAAAAPPRRLFIATCVPRDDEMHQRVARHQAERGPEWRTLEEPLGLAEAIRAHSGQTDLIVVDCLTLWLSNLMLADESLSGLDRRLERAGGGHQGRPLPRDPGVQRGRSRDCARKPLGTALPGCRRHDEPDDCGRGGPRDMGCRGHPGHRQTPNRQPRIGGLGAL